MRSHILTRGYDFCKKSDFEWIVDNTTGVLSRYLVEYNMDSHNTFSALKIFGDEVRYMLEANGMERTTLNKVDQSQYPSPTKKMRTMYMKIRVVLRKEFTWTENTMMRRKTTDES